MIEKLAELEKTHQELTQRLSDPAIFSDPKAYREVNKTLSEIDPTVRLYREYVKVQKRAGGERGAARRRCPRTTTYTRWCTRSGSSSRPASRSSRSGCGAS